jgi:hypothetical protein
MEVIYVLQMAVKFTNIFHSKALPYIYTQIDNFGMQIYHLATLSEETGAMGREIESRQVIGCSFFRNKSARFFSK